MFFFKNYGLLGQNARNLQYIKGENFSIAKKIADSKLKTKEFLRAKGIPVPETILVLRKHRDIKEDIFKKLTPPFVVKPNNGYGGKGILIFEKEDAIGNLITNSGEVYSKKKLINHFTYIIDGFFSLSGLRDKVLIERKIVLSSEIDLLGKFGLPDIRVIVYNMVPVMAMLRVPTAQSDGKANLHGGACGVGIDIGTGKLTFITKKGKIIKSIPGIGDVRGIKLPFWNKVLALAVSVQKITGIKYLGCDVVLDKDFGPLLLEINIRAGLEVQVTNLSPLKSRLEKVEGISVTSVEKGVRLGMDIFSGDIEEKIKSITGKKILGTKEYINIFTNDKNYRYLANIKVSQNASYIDRSFLENILKITSKNIKKIKLECKILGKKKTIKFLIKNLESINIILGVSSLKGFLVDPFKYKKGEVPISDNIDFLKGKNIAITKNYQKQLLFIDKALMKIDKKLLILKYITPINLEEEKQKFIDNLGDYTPVFKYKELEIDLENLEKDLKTIEIPEINLNGIYNKKKQEILNKILFLDAFKKQDTTAMYDYSRKIYGDIIIENFEQTKDILLDKDNIKPEEEFLSFDEIKDYINKFNHIYGIKISLKTGTQTARFVMKGDNLIFRNSSEVGKREMRSIIAHEIEGHYLRRVNGKKLDLSIFLKGTAFYSEIEEGIAIYNQSRFLTKTDQKFYSIFERYFFIHYAMKYSYRKLIKKMLEYYEDDYGRVFNYIVRLKRGYEDVSKPGCFMKDVVYVNGYLSVKDYLDKGGDLKELYIGKIHIKDLEEINNSYILKLNLNDLKIPFFL